MRRLARVLVAVALVAACGDDPSNADERSEPPRGVRRVSGADAYEIAAALATEKYRSTSDPILASGEDPADALAGSFLGGLHASPVLLTRRDALPPATLAALRSIDARTVHVLGGTASIDDAVLEELTAHGFVPNRIAGADRFATAAAAAREENSAIIGTWPGEGRTALLANGFRPVDALTAGPFAYSLQLPMLLTDTGTLPPSTMAALDDLDIAHVMVLGGTAAVADGVLAALEASGRTVRRVAGVDRAATAVRIAGLLEDELGADTSERVVLVAADATAEATALGPYAAPSSPILLCVEPDDCGPATRGWAASHRPTEVVVAGDAASVSDAAAADVAG